MVEDISAFLKVPQGTTRKELEEFLTHFEYALVGKEEPLVIGDEQTYVIKGKQKSYKELGLAALESGYNLYFDEQFNIPDLE